MDIGFFFGVFPFLLLTVGEEQTDWWDVFRDSALQNVQYIVCTPVLFSMVSLRKIRTL